MEEVKYTMTLNDLVSGKLEKAEGHAKKFESTLGKLGERALRVGETLGISFGIIKLEEFFHKSTEMVHEFDIAEGQLQNTLRNVGERANMSSEQLVSMAQRLQHEIPYTTAQIVEMETALSRFENMTPEVYQKVLVMSTDIATALKRSGTEVANTLGRIMEAPAENGRLLRQLNITLTAADRKYLMQLEHTGQVAKAQTFIFQELATKGYGGAAKAAANSDPLFRYNKATYELSMQVGKAGIALESAFAPALEDITGLLQTSAQFVSNNKDLVIGLAEAVGTGVIAYGAYLAVIKSVAAYQFISNTYAEAANALSVISSEYMIAQAEGYSALTSAQWALNVAMDANPIGAIVAGVGVLVGLLSVAFGFWHGMFGSGSSKKIEIAQTYKYDTEAGQSGLDDFSDNISTASDSAGMFATTMVTASKKVSDNIKNMESFHVKGMTADKAEKLQASWQGGIEGVLKRDKAAHQLAVDIAKAKATGFTPYSVIQQLLPKPKSTLSKVAHHKGDLYGMQGDVGAHSPEVSKSSKATGSKVFNVHITIGSLVKEMKIQTTTFKEGVSKAKDMVTDALTSAVRNSEMVGDF